MNNFEQYFFSPLSKEYCVYWFWLTVLSFIFLIAALFSVTIGVYKGELGLGLGLLTLISPFLIYFNNRLLYSMCLH